MDQPEQAVGLSQTCVPELQSAPPQLRIMMRCAASGDVMEIVTVANPVAGTRDSRPLWCSSCKLIRKRDLRAARADVLRLPVGAVAVDPFAIKDAILHHDSIGILQQRRAYSFYLSGMIPVLAIFPAMVSTTAAAMDRLCGRRSSDRRVHLLPADLVRAPDVTRPDQTREFWLTGRR